MIKLLQADNFYKQEDVQTIFNIVSNLSFIEKEHGYEIDRFNFIIPNLEPVFSKLLGDKIAIDEDNSGVFRKPNLRIHFEGFDNPNEWVFILALEETTFNLYYHVSDGPGSKADARNVFDNYKFDYNNFLEWDCYTNILLEPNQGVIFRPWLFHSLTHERLVQIYRLKGTVNG